MPLRVDLSALHAVVKQMGAHALETDFSLAQQYQALDEIDIALSGAGIEVDLSDVDVDSGLLDYKGRQVLLYIQDHGSGVRSVLDGRSEGRKYHVSDCRTLREMREKGRFERYVATNDLSGDFIITGYDWESRVAREGVARLNVCKNCLTYLNYQGYVNGNRTRVYQDFSIGEFFETYSSFFPYMPKRKAGDQDGLYTQDWGRIAGEFKLKRNYTCEICAVSLSNHRRLLHVHHRNGVKVDNVESNLQALCADCHRKQPMHDTVFVSHEEMRLLTKLRREQSVDRRFQGWERVFVLADAGVHGVLHLCKAQGMMPPDVGIEVGGRAGSEHAFLEFGWPSTKKGVAVSPRDAEIAKASGWNVFSMADALTHFSGSPY